MQGDFGGLEARGGGVRCQAEWLALNALAEMIKSHESLRPNVSGLCDIRVTVTREPQFFCLLSDIIFHLGIFGLQMMENKT